jgi:Holliday junction resolvase
MANKKYQKGVRLERKVVNEARAAGCIAFRSAGSHSPFDVVILDLEKKKIAFIQCKAGQWDEYKMNKLEDKYAVFDGVFDVIFRVEGDEG